LFLSPILGSVVGTGLTKMSYLATKITTVASTGRTTLSITALGKVTLSVTVVSITLIDAECHLMLNAEIKSVKWLSVTNLLYNNATILINTVKVL
jgi:hypothetical protein